MRAAAGVAGMLALAALASACGEKQEPIDGPASPPSRQQYLQRANAICVQLGRETRQLAERSFGRAPPSGRALRDYERRAQDLQDRRLGQLRALQPPAGDGPRVGAVYDAWETARRDLARLPADKPGTRTPPSVERFQQLAAAYGLRDCAGAART